MVSVAIVSGYCQDDKIAVGFITPKSEHFISLELVVRFFTTNEIPPQTKGALFPVHIDKDCVKNILLNYNVNSIVIESVTEKLWDEFEHSFLYCNDPDFNKSDPPSVFTTEDEFKKLRIPGIVVPPPTILLVIY